MKNLEFIARDKEKMRLLTARAERAIEESLGPGREILVQLFMDYKVAHQNGNARDMRLTEEALSRFLDQLDSFDTGIE